MKTILAFLFLVITGRFRQAFDVVRHLNLGTQMAFVGLGLGSYAVHQYPSQLYAMGERGYYAARLATAAKTDGIPVSRAGQQRLAELIKTLQNDQSIELRRRDLGIGQGYNTWAVAQFTVALGDASPVEPAAIQRFYETNIDPDCACWRETPQHPPHTGATGWTVFSMSSMRIKAPPRVLAYLLALQSPDGWWPIHPTRLEPKSASTYSTAWATLALCSQLPLQQPGEWAAELGADVGKIKFAIENALNWLAKNEISQSARWLDYPANSAGIKSSSVAGLVIHVMQRCGYHDGTAKLHQRWLDTLPVEVSNANTTEVSNIDIQLKGGGLDFDRTRHYVLQWGLIATVDAYASGGLMQHAAALQWIERILSPGLVSPEVRNQHWVSAELLYALKYLQAGIAPAGRKLAGP